MLSIVIPFVDQFHLLTKTLDQIIKTVYELPDLILVDNGSDTTFETLYPHTYIRNDKNVGVFGALQQGIKAATTDIVITMHSDVLLWENDWDLRIENEFANDPLLALVGLFGGRSVSYDGGRGHPESNMVGKEWGSSGGLHGHLLTDKHPAVVFDSLFLGFRKSIFNQLPLPNMPPHHWFDRIITLVTVLEGYHALTLGIPFDHYGGGTSVATPATPKFDKATAEWVSNNNIPLNINPDYTMYKYGEALFQKIMNPHRLISVDRNFNVSKS